MFCILKAKYKIILPAFKPFKCQSKLALNNVNVFKWFCETISACRSIHFQIFTKNTKKKWFLLLFSYHYHYHHHHRHHHHHHYHCKCPFLSSSLSLQFITDKLDRYEYVCAIICIISRITSSIFLWIKMLTKSNKQAQQNEHRKIARKKE